MRLKSAFVPGLLAMIIAGLIVAGDGRAEERKPPFPSYGSGPVEVRIYSDYFCPPCRAMEPSVETILKDLLKKKVIQLILVDTPFHRQTALYGRLFLHALKKNNDVDHALRVRKILFEASTDKSITTQERIEAVFMGNGISHEVFDVQPVFDRYNILITEDKINTTPTCVIIKSGQKKTVVGELEIVKALKSLQEYLTGVIPASGKDNS